MIAMCLVACGLRPPPPDNHKPVAPVDVHAVSRHVGGGVYDVTVYATPTVDVDALELEVVDNSRRTFPATPAGTLRSHTARVSIDGPGAVAVASARVTLAPGLSPNKITEVTLGTPQPAVPPTVRVVRLPNGERIDEVRP